MHTALRSRLTDTQFSQLEMDLCARVQQLDTERQGSDWYAKRELYERIAKGDFSHRIILDERGERNTVFSDPYNQSLQTVRAVNRFLEARICKDLFGGDPWFAVKPQGPLDTALAAQIQPHAAYKLREAGARGRYRNAVKRILELGECPIKTTWRVTEDVSERWALVLTDVTTGKAVMTADGGYIFPEDETADLKAEIGKAETLKPEGAGENWESGNVESGDEFGGDATLSGLADAPDGQPRVGADANPGLDDFNAVGVAETEPPAMPEGTPTLTVFVKAPEVAFDPSIHEWREQLIEERTRLYAGLDIVACEWRDVLWPLNVEMFEDGDIAHRADMRLGDLRAQYDPEGQDKEFQAALGKLQAEGPSPKSEAALPKDDEPTVNADQNDTVVQVTEFYFDRDVFNDGTVRRCYAIMHEATSTVLWLDYRVAISPRGQKPMHQPVINRVPGRAYGIGNFEMFEMPANQADAKLNQINFSDELVSNPPKVWNPHRTVEGKANPNLRVTPGMTLTADSPQYGPADIFAFVKVPDTVERAFQMMQLFMQLIQAESGVTNAAQAAVSSLPGNDLATGINALTEVASVLHLHLLEEMKEGFQCQVSYSIEVLYFRQDRDETYQYLEGQADEVLALGDAEKLRALPMNVEILLTRAKRQEQREAALAAIPVATGFYALPPPVQMKLRPMYVQAIAGMGFDQPESFFSTPEELAPQILEFLAATGWTVLPPATGVQPFIAAPEAGGNAEN